MTTIEGVDLASWQGQPDFDAMRAAGIAFAIIKFTEGATYPNPVAPRNWAEALRVGMVRGAYHYAHPELNTVAAEATYIVNHFPTFLPGDFIMLDAEAGTGLHNDWYYALLQALEARYGFAPLLYSGLWYLKPDGIVGDVRFARYGLVLADYSGISPAAPPPWTDLAMWQYSETGVVPGVSGNCDRDLFYGSADQLRAYGKPAKPAPVTRQPTNDDLVFMAKLLLSDPPQLAQLAGVLPQFQIGDVPHAIRPPSSLRRQRTAPAGAAPDAAAVPAATA